MRTESAHTADGKHHPAETNRNVDSAETEAVCKRHLRFSLLSQGKRQTMQHGDALRCIGLVSTGTVTYPTETDAINAPQNICSTTTVSDCLSETGRTVMPCAVFLPSRCIVLAHLSLRRSVKAGARLPNSTHRFTLRRWPAHLCKVGATLPFALARLAAAASSSNPRVCSRRSVR